MATKNAVDPVVVPASTTVTDTVMVYIGDKEFSVPVTQLTPTPTGYAKEGELPRVKLDDGSFYPCVHSVRDKVTGKVFDYVVRGRLVDAMVMNASGIGERRRVYKAICRKLERIVERPTFDKPEDRFEVVK